MSSELLNIFRITPALVPEVGRVINIVTAGVVKLTMLRFSESGEYPRDLAPGFGNRLENLLRLVSCRFYNAGAKV